MKGLIIQYLSAFFLCFALSFSLRLYAQNEVQWADYTRLKSFYNPAVSGTDGLLNVCGAYSMQFVGYDNAPNSMYIGADLPIYFLSPRHGAGISLLSDAAGIFTTTRIAIQYALNIKTSKKGRLAIGFQAAMLQESIDASDINLEDNTDPAFPSSSVSGQKIDLGAGLYYYHPKLFVGLSALHLLAPCVVLNEKYEYNVDRTYYLMAGCNIKPKHSLITLQPSLLIMTDLNSWREDIQCKAAYEYEGRSFYIGLGYSPSVSTTFLLGGDLHGISLGYSYQMYTSGIGLINGSHELTLAYKADLDLFKKGRNLHRSVRFL